MYAYRHQSTASRSGRYRGEAGLRRRAPTSSDCATKYGYSAAPLIIDGAVVAGTLDGEARRARRQERQGAEDHRHHRPGADGQPGVPGKGGSIDAHAISAGAGMVFVNSGYGSFSQTPGNVLIALKPVKK